MSESEILCPECKRPIEREGERFCSWCRFPVMEIAGKYRLLTKLGEGGVGEVYLAEHIGLRRDDKRVLKFIKREYLATESVIKRFRREMEVTSMLARRNQHIVQIFDDFGEVPGLGFFYAMEHVEGNTLRSELQWRKRFGGKRALHIFQQLCEAMAVVHKEGLIHRDLKPENILLTTRNEDTDFVKVIDFGLTRSLDGNVDTALTQGGVGTPAYMSPEQCANLPIDARTDIYAMGILLYEMLTGKLPFDLPHQSSGANMAAFAAHIMEAPIPMRQRTPHLHISESLDQVVLRALAKPPAERYPSAELFWETLALFEGDICKEINPDTFPPEERERAPHSSKSYEPLPSGILDAYPSVASDPIGQTVVAPPAIGEMVTLPVAYDIHPSPAPPPSHPNKARLKSLLLLLLGFGMASTLAAGFLVWWVYSGEPAGGSYVVKKLKKPAQPRQIVRAITTPQPATTKRVPQPTTTRQPPALHIPSNRTLATAQTGIRQPTLRRILKRQKPTQKVQKRSPRSPKRRRITRRKPPRRRPINKTLAFEQSAAFHKAQQVLEAYHARDGTQDVHTAMAAYLALAQGYRQSGANAAKQRNIYIQVLTHFSRVRRAIHTGANIYNQDIMKVRYQLALLAFQDQQRFVLRTTTLQQNRVDMETLLVLTNRAIRLFKSARHKATSTQLQLCSWAREGDTSMRQLEEIYRSLDLLETQNGWSAYQKSNYRHKLLKQLPTSRRNARTAYNKTLSVGRHFGYRPSAPCIQRAKKQIQLINKLYWGHR